MKKFLSLVLALVMTMSLVTISAGAKDFTDNNKVTYTEAVDVISALGVVNGYEDGSFKPTNTLTRGAAAKIICNLLLTPAVASTLTADAAPFKDVPVTNTFAGYIAYVAQQGIINGYKDGTFKPAGGLTGYAFMKMLLGALGYSSANEGFTGNNWTINVATKIADAGLANGNDDFNGNKIVTREEAALYAFNMGNAKVVSYTGGSKITINGITFEQGGSLVPPTENTPTFFNKNFKNLALNENIDKDAFGRPAHQWTLKGKKIGTYNDTPVVSYTGPVKVISVYKDLGLTGDADTSIARYVDGESATAVTINRSSTSTIVPGTTYGVTTEVYKTASNPAAYRVVEISTYAAEVTKVNPAKAATATADAVDRSVTLKVFYDGAERTMNFPTEQYAVGDVLAVTISKSGTAPAVETAASTKTVQGKVEKYTTSSVVIGGTTYNIGTKSGFTPSAANFTNEAVFYVDDNNVIVRSTGVNAVSTDYVYVEEVQAKNTNASLFDTAAVSVKAKVIFTDGAHSVVDLAVTKVNNAYTVMMPASDGTVASNNNITTNTQAVPVGNWFAYTKDADGAYTLSQVSNLYAVIDSDGLTLPANTSYGAGNGLVTTSETKIVAVDTDYKVSSITGFPAVNANLTGKVLLTYAKGSNKIAAIYAVGQTSAPATAVNYAYAVESGSTTAYGTEWTFAIDGKLETVVIAAGNTVAEDQVYTLTTAANGTYNVSAKTLLTVPGTVSLTDLSFFQAKVAATGEGTQDTYANYVYGNNVKVYNVSNTVEDFGKADVLEVGDTVKVITDNNTLQGKVLAVYITVEAEA